MERCKDVFAFNPMIKDGVIQLLERYKNVFAFNPSKMPRIAPNAMEHKLRVDLNHEPIIQKRWQLEEEMRWPQ